MTDKQYERIAYNYALAEPLQDDEYGKAQHEMWERMIIVSAYCFKNINFDFDQDLFLKVCRLSYWKQRSLVARAMIQTRP